MTRVWNHLFVKTFAKECGSEWGFSAYLQNREVVFNYTLYFSTRNLQMDAKSFYFILKSTFELFGSSFRKEKILSMQLYEDLMLYTNWKVLCYLHLEKKNFVHIAHHEGLKYCVTAKPSGIQSTELSFVWHPGSSLLQMETQAPFNFTNIFFYHLLCSADTFLSFTLENSLISHGIDN